MTQNQVAYLNYVETARANLVSERETERHNRAMEQAQLAQVAETHRSNAAQEAETHRRNTLTAAIDTAKIYEQQRSNLAGESLARSNLDEVISHNRTSEYLSLFTLAETRRSNMAREEETNRSNVAKEKETYRYNSNQQRIQVADLDERSAHNQATEYLDAWKAQHDWELKQAQYGLDVNKQNWLMAYQSKQLDNQLLDIEVRNSGNLLSALGRTAGSLLGESTLFYAPWKFGGSDGGVFSTSEGLTLLGKG